MKTGKKNLFGQLARYGSSTLFSAACSFGLPVLLHELFAVEEKLAVAIGFATAYVANIALLKLFVFRSDGNWKSEILRYIPTNGAFRLLEYGAFLGLYSGLGVDYRLSVLLVLGISAILKFFAYRLIFTGPR